ncbi:hypothetical protein SAMD00019534_104590 [Acytostelium subglobosum LB1]|uniref:hypothetical protein n=1 Tax=Acytostelium subglobosum LB1 TaxID=1410327 RepID=UPI000644CA09|nr:hypothetical protein SAMD00019534_104590 [Acytostelium subglobosum LB1]GAM27284.1 hypothetical protein SAMD00019534_104590 [Acytostelium subglobosum LB1]|eukprot:XP_012749751.1 hypothetical protein SAMD00019534_104590 [Acytostelium subglobosum LB1]
MELVKVGSGDDETGAGGGRWAVTMLAGDRAWLMEGVGVAGAAAAAGVTTEAALGAVTGAEDRPWSCFESLSASL